MARGRKTSLTISLTPEERQTLRAWQRATIVPSGVSRRARMILLLAEGRSITAIAATVGISRRFVYKWAQRFLAEGVAGLVDRPGRGGSGHARGPYRSRPPRPWDNALAGQAARARSGGASQPGVADARSDALRSIPRGHTPAHSNLKPHRRKNP